MVRLSDLQPQEKQSCRVSPGPAGSLCGQDCKVTDDVIYRSPPARWYWAGTHSFSARARQPHPQCGKRKQEEINGSPPRFKALSSPQWGEHPAVPRAGGRTPLPFLSSAGKMMCAFIGTLPSARKDLIKFPSWFSLGSWRTAPYAEGNSDGAPPLSV